jgi:Zn-dependent protease with chaperone function
VYEVYNKLTKANNFLYPPYLKIKDSNVSNASSEGRWIVITTAMLRDIKNKDELARVLGHELGHHYNHHIFPSKANEYDADRKAIEYMEKAKYNKCIAAELFKRRNSGVSKHHPSDRDRLKKFNCPK